MAETGERTVERGDAGARGGAVGLVDHLFLALEGARPLAGGARWSLAGVDEVVLRRGSSRSATREDKKLLLKLPDSLLSSSHARLTRTPDGWVLEDLGSTNGTFLDGARLGKGTRALLDGARIETGAAQLVFRRAMPTPANAAAVLEGDKLVGRAHGMASLVPMYADALAALARVATSGLSVLLLGESGTGKEVLASAVHALSGRAGTFVPINCGALTATLVESQLFGHTKGAFSGAIRDEPGFVRSSDGGTLFLDEIGDLPAPAQATLLRVLEMREVVPVGSARAIKVDLRVVSATLRGTDSLRADLHARLAGYTHTLVPLRERREDMGLLVAELLTRSLGPRAKDVQITPEAGRALLAHPFPLNVRELAQALEVALVLAEGAPIEARHLPASVRTAEPAPEPDDEQPERGAPPVPDDPVALRALVVATLEAHHGNVTDAAKALGRTRMQIHRWMRRFGLQAETFRP